MNLSLLLILAVCQCTMLTHAMKWNALRVKAMKTFASVSTASLVTLTPVLNAHAVDFATYENKRYQTKLSYPAKWEAKAGELSGDRIVEAFVDPSDAQTSVSVVFTPIPADYNRLNSFGGKDTLRQYLLPAGEGVTTEVVQEKVYGETYTLEYIIDAPNVPKRHIQSVFALKPQDCVVGLTIQTNQDSYDNVKDVLNQIAPSLKIES